jgi:hypothetical protein
MLIAPFILKYFSFFFLAPFSCLLLLLPVILSVPNQKNLLLVISIQFSLYILVLVQGRPVSLVPRKEKQKKNIIIKGKERYLIACHLFVNLFG